MKYEINNRPDYSRLKRKIFLQAVSMVFLAVLIIGLVYLLFWRNQGGDWFVGVMQNVFHLSYETSIYLYQQLFRNNTELIWLLAVTIVFFVLFFFFLSWFTRYFNEINRGIDELLSEADTTISLIPEMAVTEQKLNTVRKTLARRAQETRLAEQRKNDLVMYLAHDIRTPLTSVIGYLNLLDEAPDMPAQQRAKYVHITLDKAYRLEKLINEFFEITKYHSQQIKLEKRSIDLYYMLMQMTDELYPLLSRNGNTAVIHADENLTVYGDAEKMARVFNNLLKNAAAYSYPSTEIVISARQEGQNVLIRFHNEGDTLSPEQLSTIFDKFYRLDEARTSHTGGSGLGLSISQEIITLHGGTIKASSADHTITFTITLPIPAS